MSTTLDHLADALPLIQRGALVVVNHSGGKDSQAMLARVSEVAPRSQILVIHAHLPEVEWKGTWEHVQTDARRHGVGCLVVTAGKTFLEMVERRGMWPSATTRQCTSDLKRDPIDKAIRAYLKGHPEHGGVVISAMGLRAEESAARSRQSAWRFDARNSKSGRSWYRWLPIHSMCLDEVWETIKASGGTPHWAYGEGMTRLSCCFCIMSSKRDLQVSARCNPDLYKRYVEVEKRLGHTLQMDGRGLEEVTGIAA